VSQWTATTEDPLCTLEEAFKHVDPSVGFNIEVKFDYIEETSDLELQRVIHCTMEIVRQHSNGRKIYLSSFHPDAVHLLGSMQSTYPVWKQYLHPWFIPSNGPQLLQPFSFLCITVPGLQFSQDSISIFVGLCVCRCFS
jgi:hypothetical protein